MDGRRARVGARRVLGLVAFALVVAACVPVTPPPPPPPPPPPLTYCLGAPPASARDYETAFAGIRNSDREWILGDNAYPVALPDGRIVWIFADTVIGRLNGGTSIQPGYTLVHSSFVVQSGRCFTPVMGGTRGARVGVMPDPGAGTWLWPFTGAYDAAAGNLKVFSLRMRQDPSAPPPFDFAFDGFQVATFRLPQLTLVSSTRISRLSSRVGTTGQYQPNWNTGGFGADGWFYGYGRDGQTPQGHVGTNEHFLARAPITSAATAPWEYFAGFAPPDPSDPSAPPQATWSSSSAAAVALDFVVGPSAPPGAALPVTYLQVVPYGAGYLAAGKITDLGSDDVSTWWGPTVAGPWTYVGRAASTPTLTYCGRVVVDIPGGPLTTWCPFGFNASNVPSSTVRFRQTPATALPPITPPPTP